MSLFSKKRNGGRRIRVFLSGSVNGTNAQNLNCRALQEHLDPARFDVRALSFYSGDLPPPPSGRFTYFVRYPAKIWHPIRLVQGILWSDVAYLCKPEYWRLQRWCVRTFRKRAFRTIEGMYSGMKDPNPLALRGVEVSREELLESMSYTGHVFSITKAMREVNERELGLKTDPRVLYLGVDSGAFANDVPRTRLTDVVMVGNNLFYKGLDDYFELARRLPKLTFHVVGDGMGKVDPPAEVRRLGLANVVCHGCETPERLAETLKGVQLHVFPSRAEGFPKVTLETAAAGVPSLVYGDYGADEWIASGENGFVVRTLDEMEGVVRDLLANPGKLQPLADGARAMARRFEWKDCVKDWERVIEELRLDT